MSPPWLTLVSDVLQPEGVVRPSTTVRQGRRARRSKTESRCREQTQEGARNEYNVAQGALEHDGRESSGLALDEERSEDREQGEKPVLWGSQGSEATSLYLLRGETFEVGR